MTPPREEDLVFNVVWTGTTFRYLHLFVASQMDHCRSRYRFVGNGCPPDELDRMRAWASRHPRVVEVLDVSPDQMVAHGVALEAVRAIRDDGDHFCFIDPDIKAKGPFVSPLAAHLTDGCAAVTSGTEVWSEDNLIPVGHVGVAGQHFVGRDGFLFGSPHLALYDRAALDETEARWEVSLGSAGPDLTEAARARLAELGQRYLIYDTAKLVNAMLQADGHRVVHEDLDTLVHIGGLSHYLAPGSFVEGPDGEVEPDWAHWGGEVERLEVARFTAAALRGACDGGPTPAVPSGCSVSMRARLEMVLDEITDLARRDRGTTLPGT